MRLHLVSLSFVTFLLSVTPAFVPVSMSFSPLVAQAQTTKTRKAEADRLYREALYLNSSSYNAERAIRRLEEALSIYREIGDQAGIGETLQDIGYIYQRIEKYEEALDYYQKALPIQREIGNGDGEELTLKFIGEVYDTQGHQLAAQNQYRDALKKFQQALVIHRKLGHKESEWRTLDQMALAHTNLGEYELALEFYQQALPISKEAILGHWVGVEFKIGQIYEVLGQYELALKSYQEALELAKLPVLLVFDSRGQIGDIPGEVRVLNAIGNVHSKLKQYELALDFYQQALDVLKTVDNKTAKKSLEAATFNNIGIVYLKQGKYESALDLLQQALTINQLLGHKRPQGVFLNNIGKIYSEQEKHELALDFYQQALVIAQEIDNKEDEGNVLKNIGYLLEKQNQPELAIIFFKESVNARESIRDNIKGLPQEQQQSYTETIAEDYRHLADLLLQQNRILEAQQVLDLLKIQELDDYLRNVRGNDQTAQGIETLPSEQQLLDKYNEGQNQVIKIGKELAQLRQIPQEKQTSQQQQRIAQLVAQQGQIKRSFIEFTQRPDVVALVQQLSQTTKDQNLSLGRLTNISDNLRNLNQNAVLLYPLILEDRLELILTTPDSPPIRRTVPVKRTELNQAIVNFRQALQHPVKDARKPAQQLYDWLIKPLENELAAAEAQTIIYAPDGQLRYIPLAALHDGQGWLVERFRVNNITADSLTDFNSKPQQELRILAGAFTEGSYKFSVGQRQFSFSGLPFAKREVETLAAQVPGTTKLLDNEFTKQATIPQLDNHSVVHFATHAALVRGQPDESFILFGNGERVSMREVQTTWILNNVDLVVLSACETGLGGQLGNGEEILGFGYVMQNAGARAAIASLWKVDDSGTQALISAFYQAMKGGNITKAEALRQAQIALITGDYKALAQQSGEVQPQMENNPSSQVSNKFSHPYYWAPFILIGNGL
jgi:CHAT domain-containing protein/Tfp pilus assembly protein PilF